MSENAPQIEIVSDVLFEKRGEDWLFQVRKNGAISYLSADDRLGWCNLAPAAAIETNLHRGHLAECQAGTAPAELILTFRYPRLPVTETMTIRVLDTPPAMTIDRVLHNTSQIPLPVHEVRMLVVDAGGVFFGEALPSSLRCVYAGDFRQTAQSAGPGATSLAIPLPAQTRILGGSAADSLPALAICDATMTTTLLEASLRRGPFVLMWQIKAREDWQPGRPVLADHVAIARARPSIRLSPGQGQAASNLFYQIKTGYDPHTLCDGALAEHSRREKG